MSGPAKSCRTCWFSGMEPVDEQSVHGRVGRMRWTCMLDRRPRKRPYVCVGHAPDQERAPTSSEVRIARKFGPTQPAPKERES